MGDRTDAERLDALRLECLKVVASVDGAITPKQMVEVAQGLFDFVTDAPKQPRLFVVRRLGAHEEDSAIYLGVSGRYVYWGYEGFAYRFRSRNEAMACTTKHATVLGLTDPFVVDVIQLVDGTGLF